MPFKKGAPRPANAGRKVGSKNKPRARDLLLICEEEGIEPFREMIKLYKDETRDKVFKLQCLEKMAKYIYAQPRDIELSGPNGEPIKHEKIESSETKEIMAEFKKFINNKIVDERKD